MIKRHLSILLGITLLIIGCSKDEDIIVEGNTAPPDPTIENVIKENYVNKLYISIHGRKPTTEEYNTGLAIVNQDNISEANRGELIDIILASVEYNKNEYKIASDNLIHGADSSEVAGQIELLEFIKTLTNDTNLHALYEAEKLKLQILADAEQDFKESKTSLIEVHKAMIYNMIYDEINMGSENFVVSLFQNFLARYPTVDELEKGKDMVDGVQTVAFLEIGKNKADYINIFIDSREYFEGQVRGLFLRFLFREPTSEEMSNLGSDYKSKKDYKSILKTILSTDEYVGL